MWARAPRSTVSACGSLNALDHRVAGSPSTALSGPRPAFSDDVAVASAPSARFVVAAWAGAADTARVATSVTTVSSANRGTDGRRGERPARDRTRNGGSSESAFTSTPRRRDKAVPVTDRRYR